MERNEIATPGLDFLPESLVNQMLKKYYTIIHNVNEQLTTITNIKDMLHNILKNYGLLRRAGELIHQNRYPTTVGVDGSYTIIRQLALDTVAIAAVAVEGLVPPREERHWDRPDHIVNIYSLKHHSKSSILCKALMFSYELELAVRAPHAVVYLDGSLTTYLIAFGQALSAIEKDDRENNNELPYELKHEFKERVEDTLNNYLEILSSPRSDKLYIGIPKYSSRKEIIERLSNNTHHTNIQDINIQKALLDLQKWNDKGLLTFLLDPDDTVGPVKLASGEEGWHLSGLDEMYRDKKEKIIEALHDLHVIYYKPTLMHPALRIEIGGSIATNDSRLSLVLESLQNQSRNLGIMEPYPLYIADNFVKHIYPSLIQLKDLTLSNIGASNDMRFHEIFLSLHEYRSEEGFE